MQALHGTLALAQRDHVAVGVAEQLHLDVLDVQQQLLHVDLAVAEGALRLRARGEIGVLQLIFRIHPADAAAAAAGARLDQQRIADALRLSMQLLHTLHQVAAGNHGHAGLAHGAPGLVLVAHPADDLRRGADELDLAALAQLGKARIL